MNTIESLMGMVATEAFESVAQSRRDEKSHPCKTEDGGFDHDWQFQDDSFDHEFGTERIHYWLCARCEEAKEMEAGDYDDEY